MKSKPAWKFFFQIDVLKVRERELAKSDGSRRAVGMLNPINSRDETSRHAREGITHTCGNAVQKVAVRAKLPTS